LTIFSVIEVDHAPPCLRERKSSVSEKATKKKEMEKTKHRKVNHFVPVRIFKGWELNSACVRGFRV
jgi:hypothetical protein